MPKGKKGPSKVICRHVAMEHIITHAFGVLIFLRAPSLRTLDDDGTVSKFRSE